MLTIAQAEQLCYLNDRSLLDFLQSEEGKTSSYLDDKVEIKAFNQWLVG